MISIKFFGLLRFELGVSEVELNDSNGSLKEIIMKADKQIEKDLVAEIFETDESVKKGTIILLNGRNIRYLEGIQTNVIDGDEISIFPLCGGG